MPQTSKQYFNTITIIHTALLIMQIIFGVIAYFMKSSAMFQNSDLELGSVLLVVSVVVAVGGIAASTFIGKAQIKSARQKTNLKDKLNAYKAALLIKLALLEMPTIFVLVCFLLSGNYYMLAFAMAILILFYINRPSVNNLVMDLELNQADRSTVESPNSILD